MQNRNFFSIFTCAKLSRTFILQLIVLLLSTQFKRKKAEKVKIRATIFIIYIFYLHKSI